MDDSRHREDEAPRVAAVEGDETGSALPFRWHADQRRLAEVQAARREREARRAACEADGGSSLISAEGEAAVEGANATGAEPGARAEREPDGRAVALAQSRAVELGSSPPGDRRIDAFTLQAEPAETPAAETPSGSSQTFGILVVCTGNVCRSPYVERVLAAGLAGLPVRVEGAGTGALLIDRMSSGSQALLRDRGLDPSAYRPRQLTATMVRHADLVLTATREHRRIVVDEAPTEAWKVFALLDFSDVCARSGAGAGVGLDAARLLVREARASDVSRHSERSAEDAAIIDPFRQGPEVFAQMAAQTDPALATIERTFRGLLGHRAL